MKIKHLLILMLMALVVPLASMAQTTIGDLIYTFSGSNATVTGHKDGTNATGTLTIPSTVSDGGTTYTVTSIRQDAFMNCTGLTGSLVIPNTVTVIGNNAFAGCTGFNGTLTLGNQLEIIRASAFKDCSGFTGTLTIPNSVTTLNQAAFRGCRGFTSLVLGTGVNVINTEVFYGCTGLTGTLTIPNNYTVIGQSAFYGCTGITSLNLPNSLTSISYGAFYGCTRLTGNLVIPNSVITIGNLAFSGCSGLNGTLTLSNQLTSIGESAFRACKFLTGDLTIPNSVTTLGQQAFYGCFGFNGTLTLSNQLTTISVGAFLGCSGFTGELVIPNSVQTIGNNAFVGCGSLTGLTLGSGVMSLGNTSFSSCTGLTHIIALPATPPTLGNNVFGNVPTTIPVYVPRGCDSAYQNASGWSNFTNIFAVNYDFSAVAPTGQTLYYKVTDATNHYVKVTHPSTAYVNENYWNGFTQPTGDLAIPSIVEHENVTYTVTAIDEAAFLDCAGINGLTLPNMLVSIGWNAFRLCRGTTGTLTLPSSLTTIAPYAFGSCGFTGTLSIPFSLTSISESAFQFCENFTALDLPNTLETIGRGAFYHCTGLTALALPNSLTTIDAQAFQECTGFQGELVLPNSLTTIGNNAFYHCNGFTGDLLIPNSVTSIGNNAFYDCTGFNRSLIFPARTERNLHIGNNAFYYCNFAEIIACGEIPPTPVGTDDNVEALAGLVDNVVLNVPTLGWRYYLASKYFDAIPKNETRRKTLYDFKREYNGNTYYYNVKQTVPNGSHFAASNYQSWTLTGVPQTFPIQRYWRVYLTCPGTQLNPYGGFEKPTGPIDIELWFNDQTIVLDPTLNPNATNYALTQYPCILTKIDDKAFYGCDGLTGNVLFMSDPPYIASYITSHPFEGIGADAFNGCTGLNSVTQPISFNLRSYDIGERAFYGCTGLMGDLTLRGSINSIGDYAFYGCTSLDGNFYHNTIKEIGVSAFENCSFVGDLTLQQVNVIHERAFKNSGFNGGNLRIYGYSSNKTQIIENAAFMNCGFIGIDIAEIPHEILGDSAFYGCGNLAGDLVLHRNVKTIGAHAFDGCNSLNGSLTIHDLSEMETIGEAAFKNCQFSGNLFIPATVNSIGASAFLNCDKIQSITYLGEFNNAQVNSFNGMVNTIPIRYNSEYHNQIANAAGWNYFTNWESTPTLPYSPHNAMKQWADLDSGTWNLSVTPASSGFIGRNCFNEQLNQYSLILKCESSASPSPTTPVTMVAMLPKFVDPVNMTRLAFNLWASSNSCQNFEVGYVLNDDPTSFVVYRTFAANTTSQNVDITFNGLPRLARIAFRYQATSPSAKGTFWSVYAMGILADLVSVSDLSIYNTNANSLSFEWWAQGGVQWEIKYHGYKSSIIGGQLDQGVITTDQNPFTKDEMDFKICWAQVRAVSHDDQGETFYSEWSDEVEFPNCTIVDDYKEGFEDVNTIVPNCWFRHGVLGDYPTIDFSGDGYNAHYGTYCLEFFVYNYSQYTHWDDQYCILPKTEGLSHKVLSFYAKTTSDSDEPATIRVGYVTDISSSTNLEESFVLTREFVLTENYARYSSTFFDAPDENARICIIMKGVEHKDIMAFVDDISIEEAECNLPVERFRVYSPGYTTAYLNWDDMEGLSQVEVSCYTLASNEGERFVVSNADKPYKITGLTPGQCYKFQARQYCSPSEVGEWTSPAVTIRTDCLGEYQSTPYEEGFHDNQLPPCWIPGNGSEGKYYITHDQFTPDNYYLRISPYTGSCSIYMPKIADLNQKKITLYATRLTFVNSAIHIRICTDIDNPIGNTVDVVTIGQLEDAPYNFPNETWREYEVYLSEFPNIPAEGYIEFYAESNPYNLSNTCDVCIDNIIISDGVAPNKRFVGASTSNPTSWHVAQNWEPEGVPTANSFVYIENGHQVVITQPAEAYSVDFLPSYSSITIKDGGQLSFKYGHDLSGNPLTKRYLTLNIEKEIKAYTPGEKDGYYLINIPVYKNSNTTRIDEYLPLTLPGTNEYDPQTDAYKFVYYEPYEGKEWVNCKADYGNGMNQWVKGWTEGLLFARAVNSTLRMEAVQVSNGADSKRMELHFLYGDFPFKGWNLIGNPFSCNSYIFGSGGVSVPYYRMNETGDAVILAEEGSPIGVAEGIFVLSSHPQEEVYFTTTQPAGRGQSFDFTLSKRKAIANRDGASMQVTLDRARVSFSPVDNIEHFEGLAGSNRLYIPLDNDQMSLVQSQPVGEVPLNFEAGADGQFTLSFGNHADGLAYCHLIDNLTGANVDLLETSEYTFNAKYSDYPARFKVVFASDEVPGSDNFAFFNNGNLIVANEGKATLQVIDVLGRVLSTSQINGSVETSVNVSPGVYVIRLINGDKVKTQKVIKN